MLVFVILALASAARLEAKEDSCYVLASYLVREKQEEIRAHLKAYPHLKEPELRFKAIELGYYECMKKITEDQTRVINAENKRQFSRYKNLVQTDISHLQSLQDVRLSPEFMKVRQEVGKRVSFTKKSGPKTDL